MSYYYKIKVQPSEHTYRCLTTDFHDSVNYQKIKHAVVWQV